MDIIKRFRNNWFWISMFSLLVLVGNTTGLYTIPNDYRVIVDSILAILTGLGVMVDTSTPGFKDEVR